MRSMYSTRFFVFQPDKPRLMTSNLRMQTGGRRQRRLGPERSMGTPTALHGGLERKPILQMGRVLE